MSLNRSSD